MCGPQNLGGHRVRKRGEHPPTQRCGARPDRMCAGRLGGDRHPAVISAESAHQRFFGSRKLDHSSVPAAFAILTAGFVVIHSDSVWSLRVDRFTTVSPLACASQVDSTNRAHVSQNAASTARSSGLRMSRRCKPGTTRSHSAAASGDNHSGASGEIRRKPGPAATFLPPESRPFPRPWSSFNAAGCAVYPSVPLVVNDEALLLHPRGRFEVSQGDWRNRRGIDET